MPSRPDIVAAARRYIGTPYHHQASLRGAGCDCLGLVRGIWRDLYGTEPEKPPPYTPDWGEVGATEHLLAAATRHMVPMTAGAADLGDVMIFRMRTGTIAKHAAILSGPHRMIHAQSRDRVREVTMNGWWRRRLVAVFGWPEVGSASSQRCVDGLDPPMLRNVEGAGPSGDVAVRRSTPP